MHPGERAVLLRLCELEAKEVINACDCKKLGYVVDLIIDECQGRIEAIVIPRGREILRDLWRRGGVCDPLPVREEDRAGHHPGGDP